MFSISTNDYTPQQLESLAQDIHEGKVFCSWMVNGFDKSHLETIFIPLTNNPLKSMSRNSKDGTLSLVYLNDEADHIVHVFEYLNNSFYTKENGYPSFKSCQGLKQKYIKPLMTELAKLNQA